MVRNDDEGHEEKFESHEGSDPDLSSTKGKTKDCHLPVGSCKLGTLPGKVNSLRQMSKSVSFPSCEDLHVEGLIVLRMTCLHCVKVLC